MIRVKLIEQRLNTKLHWEMFSVLQVTLLTWGHDASAGGTGENADDILVVMSFS